MTPDLPGVLSAAEVDATARHLVRLQQPSGMIPWFPGGHCDPWNLVESAMALDVAGRHAEALAAYRWLVDTQLPSGAWHNYYRADGSVEEEQTRHQRLRLRRHGGAPPLAEHVVTRSTPRRCGRRSNGR